MTEGEFSRLLSARQTGLFEQLGWRLAYHTHRSKKSPVGFPDWCLVRERVVFAELKGDGGRISEAQYLWLDGLAACGAEVYLWRPSDMDEIGRILAAREFNRPVANSAWVVGRRRDEDVIRRGSVENALWVTA